MLRFFLFLSCLHAASLEPRPPAEPPATTPAVSLPQGLHQPVPGEDIPNFAYRRYLTTDSLGRTITFYLSKAEEATPLPLILCVQGSGSQSVFLEIDTPSGKKTVSGGPEAAVLAQFRTKARVLVVEKPGVEFLVQPARPGSAEQASDEFKREHSLDRWTTALNAAIEASKSLPGVSSYRILALGHSEGGQVVCHLAALNSSITHVASLAGGGPTQLFDLIELARSGSLGDSSGTPQSRADNIIKGWRRVLKDPDSTTKMFLGHPHLRWSSFLRTSPARALESSSASVFIAQGTADTNSSPAAADMLYAELLAKGRDVAYERVEGGDHGFMTQGDHGVGWKSTIKKAVDWFLPQEAPSK